MENIGRDFWKGKRVLITGAAGFIGSHLSERLVRLGATVRAFIRYNSMNSYGLIEAIPKEVRESIEICAGDIVDETSIFNAMKDMEVVFHMAALPSIPYSFLNPRHVFLVNTHGTLNVLLAAKACRVRKIVLASSAGASEKRPLLSPYVTSKAAMEKIGLGFHQGLGTSVSIIRLFNNYGPRQSARAVIPTIISQALVRDDVHLGALEPRMDFNYISDSLEAFLRAAENINAQGKVLTWGTGISTSIAELAQLIFSVIGKKKLHIVKDEERVRPYPGSMPSLEDDISSTRKLLDFAPKISLQEGLQRTTDWMSQHIELYKTEIYAI